MRASCFRLIIYASLFLLSFFTIYTWFSTCPDPTGEGARMVAKETTHYVYDSDSQRAFPYDRDMPLIFIGGVPRSGTTLMRAMLDAHPDVRCGEETRVIPRLLGMRSQWFKSARESYRLREAGLSESVVDSALAAFILEVIAKHGEPAPRLCNKDPFTLKSSVYLSRLFPNSKYVLMIRDGRAVAHSIITRKVTISGFDLKSYRGCLRRWSEATEAMYAQCARVGADRCLPVHYEQLVLHPRATMRQVLEFIGTRWSDAVLHHERYINKRGGVSLSRVERSTDQVIKPVNTEALTSWVKSMPDSLKPEADAVAPMLRRLGYDPSLYPPKYGQPDALVSENTAQIQSNQEYWRKRGQLFFHMTKSSHPGKQPLDIEQSKQSDNLGGGHRAVLSTKTGDETQAPAADQRNPHKHGSDVVIVASPSASSNQHVSQRRLLSDRFKNRQLGLSGAS